MYASVIFTCEILPKGKYFLPLIYSWKNLDPQGTFFSPNFHPFKPIFIHFEALIQHLHELASGYVFVVPPEQKIKNRRKNPNVHWPTRVYCSFSSHF